MPFLTDDTRRATAATYQPHKNYQFPIKIGRAYDLSMACIDRMPFLLLEKIMAAQPRLFTAKRKANDVAGVVRHQSHHRDQYHAQAKTTSRSNKETVEDTYGDLS